MFFTGYEMASVRRNETENHFRKTTHAFGVFVQGFTNGTIGNTICTNGNANGTIGSHWLPMVPLVKLPMAPLGEPRTEPTFESMK